MKKSITAQYGNIISFVVFDDFGKYIECFLKEGHARRFCKDSGYSYSISRINLN